MKKRKSIFMTGIYAILLIALSVIVGQGCLKHHKNPVEPQQSRPRELALKLVFSAALNGQIASITLTADGLDAQRQLTGVDHVEKAVPASALPEHIPPCCTIRRARGGWRQSSY